MGWQALILIFALTTDELIKGLDADTYYDREIACTRISMQMEGNPELILKVKDLATNGNSSFIKDKCTSILNNFHAISSHSTEITLPQLKYLPDKFVDRIGGKKAIEKYRERGRNYHNDLARLPIVRNETNEFAERVGFYFLLCDQLDKGLSKEDVAKIADLGVIAEFQATSYVMQVNTELDDFIDKLSLEVKLK